MHAVLCVNPVAGQQVAPAAQALPKAMQAVQVPLTHASPVAEQHTLPHGAPPCVQATVEVAHVEVEALAQAVPF
jgi:hypothetical protein